MTSRNKAIAVALLTVALCPTVAGAQGVRCVDAQGHVYYGVQTPAGVTCVKEDAVAMPKQAEETPKAKLQREREMRDVYRRIDQRDALDKAKEDAEKAARRRAELEKRVEHECGKAELYQIVTGVTPMRHERIQCDEFYRQGGRPRLHDELEQKR